MPHARSGPTGATRATRSRRPRTGTEPTTARSALGLRLALSAVFLPLFAAATVGFAIWAAHQGPGESPGSGLLTVLAVVCGVLALVAAADIAVVAARRRRRERGEPAVRS
ncbi:DUF6343 family protein [Streptomyces spinosirectus]|nr:MULTISPECIES: DUF6343 family protein [Streptomyces]UIR23011.1 DUF6343 family protein [Streptomyces spinosirectus]